MSATYEFKRAIGHGDGTIDYQPVSGVRLAKDWAAYSTNEFITHYQGVGFVTGGWCLVHLRTGFAAGHWPTADHCQTVADWFEAEEIRIRTVADAAKILPEQMATLRALMGAK